MFQMSQDVQAWLKAAAEAAADVADGKKRRTAAAAAGFSGGPQTLNPDNIVVEGSAEDWACVGRESFPPSVRNEYGHLRLADFSDTVSALPHEELQAALAPPAAAAQVGCLSGGLSSGFRAVQCHMRRCRQHWHYQQQRHRWGSCHRESQLLQGVDKVWPYKHQTAFTHVDSSLPECVDSLQLCQTACVGVNIAVAAAAGTNVVIFSSAGDNVAATGLLHQHCCCCHVHLCVCRVGWVMQWHCRRIKTLLVAAMLLR